MRQMILVVTICTVFEHVHFVWANVAEMFLLLIRKVSNRETLNIITAAALSALLLMGTAAASFYFWKGLLSAAATATSATFPNDLQHASNMHLVILTLEHLRQAHRCSMQLVINMLTFIIR